MDSDRGDELLRAQAHVWNHILGFINSMALKCAIQLGILDAISSHGGRPMALSELVSALQIDTTKTRCIYRLMRKLVQSGFFVLKKMNGEEEEEEGYVLTDSSRLLLKENITSFLFVLDPVRIQPWQFLSAWFRSEDSSSTPFEAVHGVKLWEHMSRDPKLCGSFNEAMAEDGRLVSGILLDKYKGMFEGFESLVDVGGGTGAMAKAIAKEFPEMEVTVLDLPHVVAGLKGTENLKFLAGDFFQEVPSTDAVLMKWILHTWDDEACVKILRKCKEAITSNGKKKGKVMLIETVVEKQSRDIDKSIETQLFFDMQMMTIQGGRERDEREWAKLFHDAEFSDYKISPILGLRSLIEVYP